MGFHYTAYVCVYRKSCCGNYVYSLIATGGRYYNIITKLQGGLTGPKDKGNYTSLQPYIDVSGQISHVENA